VSAASELRAVLYLDHASTTPVDPRVARAMQECLEAGARLGNPAATIHGPGRAAAARIEHARAQVAALLGCEPREIVFTSGATESDNLAVLGVAQANADRGRHLVSSRLEHKAVLDPLRHLEKSGWKVSYVMPEPSGRIDPRALEAAVRADTVLVSIMHANNETGVLADIEALGAICRARGIAFHTDAAQSAGRVPIDLRRLPVDLMSVSAHRLYGPAGIGALYVRHGARHLIEPVSFGGGQEAGLRPGTLATHPVVGFGLACELARAEGAAEAARLGVLRDALWQGVVALGGVHLNGAEAPRLANILNVSIEDVDGESLVAGLPSIALSTGSACSSATREPSYVLRALGRSERLAESSLRLSLGRLTSAADIERATREIVREVTRLRAAAPHGTPAGEARSPPPEEASGAPDGPLMDLIPATRALFLELPGAGILSEASGTVLHGEAGGPQAECWVRFHVAVAGESVKDARFQARGCPHTLATAAWLTRELRGRRRDAALPGTPAQWAQTLGVPAEKLGRLLVVEDALRSCLQRWPAGP